ncbi:MAG TPA: hypothetical protein VE594_05105 [Nitrososphaeraceae archaeon]|jgi:hypothetical protein|nr:hypothetical protein [Nitrososphaeraceae archaeon]
MFNSTIPLIYADIRMCYDFEIPERIKQKNRIVSEKEEQEKEVLEPIKVPN